MRTIKHIIIGVPIAARITVVDIRVCSAGLNTVYEVVNKVTWRVRRAGLVTLTRAIRNGAIWRGVWVSGLSHCTKRSETKQYEYFSKKPHLLIKDTFGSGFDSYLIKEWLYLKRKSKRPKHASIQI